MAIEIKVQRKFSWVSEVDNREYTVLADLDSAEVYRNYLVPTGVTLVTIHFKGTGKITKASTLQKGVGILGYSGGDRYLKGHRPGAKGLTDLMVIFPNKATMFCNQKLTTAMHNKLGAQNAIQKLELFHMLYTDKKQIPTDILTYWDGTVNEVKTVGGVIIVRIGFLAAQTTSKVFDQVSQKLAGSVKTDKVDIARQRG